jgi:hypothetical protein
MRKATNKEPHVCAGPRAGSVFGEAAGSLDAEAYV